ncbi:hypothetical protein ABPG72_013760 [Tetrahymena utriculariae]
MSTDNRITRQSIQNLKQSLRNDRSPKNQPSHLRVKGTETSQKISEQYIFNGQEKEKLQNIFKKIQSMKDQKRIHDLVMNLPTRMLKSFNQKKFDLLNDRSYFYNEDTFLDQISNGVNNKRKSLKIKNISLFLEQSKDDDESKDVDNNLEDECNIEPIYTQTKFDKMLKLFSKLIDKIPIIQPSSSIKLIWDLVNMSVIICCLFFLPIVMVFQFYFTDLISQNMLLSIPTLLIVDIVINLNTGFFFKGQVTKSRIKNLEKYFKKHIFIDAICVFPFIFTLYGEYTNIDPNSGNFNAGHTPIPRIFLLPFFFKILTLVSKLKKIEERFNIPRLITNLIQLAKLLFTIILINHLFACLWVYAAKFEDDPKTWMQYKGIQDSSWQVQYLVAFYFTTVTMITVGYGDVLPKTNLEYILCIITMMIACGVFGYSLNEIGLIFSNFFQVDNEIKKKLKLIQRFMSKKNINSKLQYQAREYLEYYWRESAETDQEQEQNIISQLSESLRQKLLFEANKIVLRDSPIFKHNFSKGVIEQTVPLIQEIKYSPESLICQKGIQDDQSIYFIENGSVEIILTTKAKQQKVLLRLEKGESFGAYTFFTGLPRINNIRSKEFTTILKIKRQDFLKLISNQTEDLETFCNIRDSITYLNDFSKIGLKCKGCNSNYHMVNECQFLHYNPKKMRVIKQYNDQKNNNHYFRVSCERRNVNKDFHYKNSRSVSQIVYFHLQRYIENNGSLLDLSEEEIEYSDGHYNLSDYNIDEENITQQENNLQNKKLKLPGQELNKQKSNIEPEDFNQALIEFFSLIGQDQYVNTLNLKKNQKNEPQINVIKMNTLSENVSEHPSSINAIQSINKIVMPARDRSQTQEKNEKFERLEKSRSSIIINQYSKQSSLNMKNSQKPHKDKSRSFNDKNFDQLSDHQNIQKKPSKPHKRSSQTQNQSDQKLDEILNHLKYLFTQKDNEQTLTTYFREDKLSVYENSENSIFHNFDRMKIFVKYKPRFNYTTVISKLNQQQEQLRRQINFLRNNRMSNRKKITLFSKIQCNKMMENSFEVRSCSVRQVTQKYSQTPQNNENSDSKYLNAIKFSDSTLCFEKETNKKSSCKISHFNDSNSAQKDELTFQIDVINNSANDLIHQNNLKENKINKDDSSLHLDRRKSELFEHTACQKAIKKEEIVLGEELENYEQSLVTIPRVMKNQTTNIAHRALFDK